MGEYGVQSTGYGVKKRKEGNGFFRWSFFCRLLIAMCLLAGTGCASTSSYRKALRYPSHEYTEARDFCQDHGFQYYFDTLDDMVKITSVDKEIHLLLDSFIGSLNGRIIYLKYPPLYREGTILFPKELEKLLYSKGVRKREPMNIKTIVIDPGHGGKDPGAVSPWGIYEKDINLNVSFYLKKELERRGYRIILTRSTDRYLSLKERVAIAKRYKADLFLSIHANANYVRSVRGVEMYYRLPGCNGLHRRAVQLAKGRDFVQSSFDEKIILWDLTLTKNTMFSTEAVYQLYRTFKKFGFKIRPPIKESFYVLRYAYVPSVLLEIGYLSNRYEERMLRRTHYQKQIAETIAQGIEGMNQRSCYIAREK